MAGGYSKAEKQAKMSILVSFQSVGLQVRRVIMFDLLTPIQTECEI